MGNVPLSQVALGGVVGALVAAIANAIVFTFGVMIAGESFQVRSMQDRSELVDANIVLVIFVTFALVLMGGGVLALLNQFTSRPRQIYIGVSALALVLSFIVPLVASLPETTRLIFVFMHITAAVVGVLTALKLAYGSIWPSNNP